MHLEPLIRLVESADFLAFREICLEYLSQKGYSQVELKDGWKDGGSDFAVGVLGKNRAPLGIQVTVQRQDWKGKLKLDSRRAKSELGLTHMLYMSSRRLPQLEFDEVADELWEQDEITARPVDSQAIASFFFAAKTSDFILRSLGIPLDVRRPAPVPRPNLREDAAYAFAFFGGPSNKFRQAVVQQAVLSELTRTAQGVEKADVVDRVVYGLQLGDDQRKLVTAAIDRLTQDRRVEQRPQGLRVPDEVSHDFRTMRVLREKQWRDLGSRVEDYLADAGLLGSAFEAAHTAVMEAAGALFIAEAASAGATLGMSEDTGPLRAGWRRRLKGVSAALSAAGLSETLDRDLAALCQIVSNSGIGRSLMAGELFRSLVSMRSDEFQKALGVRGEVEIYLDASVVIPMLAALLYEPASQRFSQAAVGVYDLSRGRQISLYLPTVYLEEAASHLVEAYDRYAPLIGRDTDLRFSTNAFVAHYADLRHRDRTRIDFSRYAASLGYDRRNGEFRQRRDRVMGKMRPLLRQYGIEVIRLDKAGTQARTEAQRAVTFTANELNLVRTGRLLDHDAATIAHFVETDADSDRGRLFCTWDRLHLRLRSEEGKTRWQALDPAMLGDVLVLSRGVGEDEELRATTNVAMELTEEEGERGASVLDGLVRIEREAFHDAELMRVAVEFKESYLRALKADSKPDDLSTAWATWKGGDESLRRSDV